MEKLTLESIGILMLFLLMSHTSFSQNYEKQSVEVQNKMDVNKIDGVSIWNGISTSYNVYTEGLNSTGEETVLQRAKLQPEILSITITENGKVILICHGGTRFDSIKKIFSNLVTNITKIEKNTYIL